MTKTYEGRPLDVYVAREHLRSLRAGKEWFRRNDVIDEICEHHESLGGHIEDGTNKKMVFKKALQQLKRQDEAERDGLGRTAYWRIKSKDQEDRIDLEKSSDPRSSWNEVPVLNRLGDGEEAVYMVFYERHKNAAKAHPTKFGTGSALGKYPCKVGMTRNGNDYLGRVGDQFPLAKTKDDPITIGLVYHCEKAEFVEKYVHGQLGVLGRQYVGSVPGGKEWFLTDPDEVIGMVKAIERLSDVER